MTAQILIAELTSLVQESKRKSPELRNAAEKSLQDLKSLSVTSETQLAADLVRRPQFIAPFLIACRSKNVKFAGSGAGCLQRLAVSSAVPRDRLKEVIDALKECGSTTTSALDVQLKILQTLPALSQNYSAEIRGELLFGLLQICSVLQAAKNPAVRNSAAATLQQLIIAIFENLDTEDHRAHEVPTVASVSAESGSVLVRPVAHDAYRTFNDLCLLIEGSKPKYIKFSLPQSSGLELIEGVLSNHATIFSGPHHPEQRHVLRSILLPSIIRALSERQSFPITVRIMRVISVIIRHHLTVAPSECEVVLSLLNHMLEPDAASPWKRAIVMEIFRMVYSDISLVLQICSMYDDSEGKKKVLRDNLTLFVRLASEKPSLIGLGQQSTTPLGGPEDEVPPGASMADVGVAGLLGGPPTINKETAAGISTYLSSVRVSCIDQLDKTDAPQLPETYVYSLVLTCINSLSENLTRFILPLTVHRENKGRRRAEPRQSTDQEAKSSSSNGLSRSASYRRRIVPVNPLELRDHKSYDSINAIASLIDQSWPAVMACCSTFLYAALDNDHYRALVRSFQKFTQVAGLLRMATPRDAFLTTLGKAAVPANIIAATSSPLTPIPESPSVFQNAKGLLSVEGFSPITPADHRRTVSGEFGAPALNGRNLLCLRALLNIAIALGPTMETAWEIVCETLQQAEMVMATSTARGPSRDARPTNRSSQQSEEGAPETIASEVTAVQAAAKRMFESTTDFPNDSFQYLLSALCKLLQVGDANRDKPPHGSPGPGNHQRRVSRLSTISTDTDSQTQDHVLALQKVAEVASLNIDRFVQPDDDASGWSLLVQQLSNFACRTQRAKKPRKLAAEIFSHVVQDAVRAGLEADDDSPLRSKVQKRSLEALLHGITNLNSNEDSRHLSMPRETDMEVHLIWLQALRAIVERCGDGITEGWDAVFDIILSAFQLRDTSSVQRSTNASEADGADAELRFRTVKLGRAAFDATQLVCSDFVRFVPDSLQCTLVDTVFRFCAQTDDLNISLTMTANFWQLSDLLQNRMEATDLTKLREVVSEDGVTAQHGSINDAQSSAGTWMYLLARLNIMTADLRPEVRNTAVHTVLRVFGNCELSATAWIVCFRYVLLQAIAENVARQKSVFDVTSPVDSPKAWEETTDLLLSGFAELLVANAPNLVRDKGWPELWEATAESFSKYLELEQLSIHGIVYAAINKILSQEHVWRSQTDDVDAALKLWLTYPPSKAYEPDKDENNAPHEAYVDFFSQIFRLFHARMLTGVLEKCVENLLDCVGASHGIKYSPDVDTMTLVQSKVSNCFGEIHRKCPAAQSLIVQALATAIALPYSESIGSKRLTFVAFAKSSMDLLHGVISGEYRQRQDLTNPALKMALESLLRPIGLKYLWPYQGKSPPLWKKATTTALAVLEHCLSHATVSSANGAKDIWLCVVNIAGAIAKADCSSLSDINAILADEQFDIEALTTLRKLIHPALGSTSISSATRRLYTSSLFLTSLIHKAEPGEFPNPPSEPLSGLYDVRLGRTTKPFPNVRSRMAYFCLQELLSLTTKAPSHCASEPERIKLAQAAAPYLILRAALSLKSYIADQPLRGRGPQPYSQREELLFVLQEMRKLRSEPRAIPEVDGAKTEERRHLVRLFSLATRAVEVSGRCKGLASDEEVLAELVGWVGDVGDEFAM